MKVKDVYSIDEDDLFERSETSDYWAKAWDFYCDVKERSYEYLTRGQEDWLGRIENDLDRSV